MGITTCRLEGPVDFYSVGQFVSGPGWRHLRRTIDTFELMFVRRGVLPMRVGEQTLHIEAGQIALLPPNVEHAGADIRILPGITAMLAAAARAGAPLGHDFCAINLSDNLKPFAVIERRLHAAIAGDFAIAFYNPRSKARPEGFARVLEILRAGCEPGRLITFARAVSSPDEALCTVTLAEARPEMADMRTVVLVGNSGTRRVGRWVYTPRGVKPYRPCATQG